MIGRFLGGITRSDGLGGSGGSGGSGSPGGWMDGLSVRGLGICRYLELMRCGTCLWRNNFAIG